MRKKRISHPAPNESSRLYIQLEPKHIALFRFFLEAEDNLAIFTVVDKFRAVLLLRFSPHQKKELLQVLENMVEFPVSIVYNPEKI